VVVSRAVSTVLDASMAVLLVSAAAVALVTVPGGDQRPADPDAAARTVLASTATATYQADAGAGRRTVSGRAGTLLAHAAVAERRGRNQRFVRAVEAGVADVLARVDGRVAVTATTGDVRVRVGEQPPPSASVAAVSHDVVAENRTVSVTVRTWSP
jgi:autotransporter translocation and assembly factor TamB